MVGITGKMEEIDVALPPDKVEASNQRRQIYINARHLYTVLDKSLSPFSLVSGNISPFHVLRPDSWILVYFMETVFLGQGKLFMCFPCQAECSIVKIIYVEGGGKTPSHNYTPSCSDILKISRIVVLLFKSLGRKYNNPLFIQPHGY